MKINSKLILPIILSSFILIGCGQQSNSSNNPIDDGGDISEGGDTGDTGEKENEGTEDPINTIKISQHFTNITYSSKGETSTTSLPSEGTISFDKESITLSNLTGGDSVSFDVEVTNDSTILCYYRRVFEPTSDNGLFNLLNVTSNGWDLSYGKSSYQNKPTTWTGETYTISISLPEAYGNDMKDKSCTILISHEEIEDRSEYSKYEIDGVGYSDFRDAISYLDSGDTLTLNENVNINSRDEEIGYTIAVPSRANNITIEGNGNAIKMGGTYSENVLPNSNNKSPAGFTFEKQGANDRIGLNKKMTFKNVHFYNQKEYSDIQYPDRCISYMYFLAENIEFINCSFDNGIIIYGNAKFTNCLFTVDTPNMYNIFIDHEKDTQAGYTVEANNCTFVASNTAYGCFKVACDAGATIYLRLHNNVFNNDTSKSAVYINGVTIVEASNNSYYGTNINGIVAKGNACSLNGAAMISNQSYEQ